MAGAVRLAAEAHTMRCGVAHRRARGGSHGAVWHGAVRCGTVQCGAARCGAVRCGAERAGRTSSDRSGRRRARRAAPWALAHRRRPRRPSRPPLSRPSPRRPARPAAPTGDPRRAWTYGLSTATRARSKLRGNKKGTRLERSVQTKVPSSLSSEALLLDSPDSSLCESAAPRCPPPPPLLPPVRCPRRDAVGSPACSPGCARHRTGTMASMRSSCAAQPSTDATRCNLASKGSSTPAHPASPGSGSG